MGDRTSRRDSRLRLRRVSVIEVELQGSSLPRRLEMEKERRLGPISARAVIIASAAVAQERTYMKARLYRQVHYQWDDPPLLRFHFSARSAKTHSQWSLIATVP
jgi:hypothetical protein